MNVNLCLVIKSLNHYFDIQIVEISEAHDIQKCWLEPTDNIKNIDSLITTWNNRKPWIGDNLSVWNDLISWRQTYYSFLNSHDFKMDYIKTLQVNC